MIPSAIIQWFACMLPGTEASYKKRGNGLQRAVRKCLRIALLRIPALVSNPREHKRLMRTLASPQIICLTKRHPKLVYKYLSDHYLARNMTARTRLAALTHHYEFVRTRLHPGFLENMLANRLPIWMDTVEGHRFDIKMSFPYSPHHPDRFADHEGDLALAFAMDDVPLYALCFSIVPGSAVNLAHGDVLFLGRLQGADGRFEQIRQATRLLHDISPRDILLEALQGIAATFGIAAIVGVSNAEQLSKSLGPNTEDVLFDYDRFWDALHAHRTVDNLFMLPLPIPEKPIETIAQKHRSRTLRKRRYKESVRTEICDEFRVHHLATSNATHAKADMDGTMREDYFCI